MDEMEVDRICNRQYRYMMATDSLANLGDTLGSEGKPKYIKRGHFSKGQQLRTVANCSSLVL